MKRGHKNKRAKKPGSRKTKVSTGKMVVKRKGHCQKYDERKVFNSALFACRNAHLLDKECREIASKVSGEVTKFFSKESGKRTSSSCD